MNVPTFYSACFKGRVVFFFFFLTKVVLENNIVFLPFTVNVFFFLGVVETAGYIVVFFFIWGVRFVFANFGCDLYEREMSIDVYSGNSVC
jgi:hypothetical protein